MRATSSEISPFQYITRTRTRITRTDHAYHIDDMRL